MQGFTETPVGDLYPVPLGGFNLDLAARLELILRADRAARAFDPRIVQVRASYSEELRRILDCGFGRRFRQRYAAVVPAECVCHREG